jgi:precorrin-2/cobalt-factor-2 C20-methyltransferase
MTGMLYGLGVGPGDPELITLKALRLLQAAPVVAYPAPDDGPSFARAIVAGHLEARRGAPPVEVPIIIPMRAARFPAQQVYDHTAEVLADHLTQGRDVAVLCEGDPFFYGSFMYLFGRLADRFPTEVVPGVSSMMTCAAAIGTPLSARNDSLTVLPAPMAEDKLRAKLENCDAAVVMKLGRNFPKVRKLFDELGLTDYATYVERASLENQRVLPLREVPLGTAPYFSMILMHRRGQAWSL